MASSDSDSDALVALLRQIPDVILGWQAAADGTERISFLGTAANYVGSAPSVPARPGCRCIPTIYHAGSWPWRATVTKPKPGASKDAISP
ncbi:MAG: hypothetical protein WDN69_25725 [Aliidongia sp.]